MQIATCSHCVFTHVQSPALTRTHKHTSSVNEGDWQQIAPVQCLLIAWSKAESPLNPHSCFSRVPLITQTVTARNLVGSVWALSLRCNITGRKQVLRCRGLLEQPLQNKPACCLWSTAFFPQSLTCQKTLPLRAWSSSFFCGSLVPPTPRCGLCELC